MTDSETMSNDQRERLYAFVRETHGQWRELFTETKRKIDSTLGLAVAFDGGASVLVAMRDDDRDDDFWNWPQLSRAPKDWRDKINQYLERARAKKPCGMLRVTLVFAENRGPFVINILLDLGHGAVS